MRLLLDTHALLWWLADDPKLPKKARAAIQKGTNQVYVSAASAWEISIKKAAGKLKIPDDLEIALSESRFELLSISFSHALLAGSLPRHHEDPFDRLLVAQAKIEGLTLVTKDTRISPYGIKIQWD